MASSNIIIWSLKNRNVKEIFARLGDVIVGWLIRPFSFITPRNKRKWIIGNKTGWGDNSKYLRILLENNNENLRLIWIAKDKSGRDLVRGKGFEAYKKWSIKGIYHALTAGAYFYSSNINDINYWVSGKVFSINMWHGVGLKKLGMKQSETYNPKDISTRIFTPFYYHQPSYFIGPSDMMARHFADCYNMTDKQMLKIGYPRCEYLLLDNEKRQKFIEKYESEKIIDLIDNLKIYSKVYVYMPTFRDDQHDFIKQAGFDFKRLNNILKEKNSILMLKLHPATRIGDVDFDNFSNLILLDKNIDIYPLLPSTDVLITDYSSIYYDYILMKDKDVILFPFDYKDYVENSRDFAFDYLTFSPGIKAWNFDELYDIIKEEPDLSFKERDKIIETFWGKNFEKPSMLIKETTKKNLHF